MYGRLLLTSTESLNLLATCRAFTNKTD